MGDNDPRGYASYDVDELRTVVREAILELPTGVQSQFEKLLDDQEIVASVIDEIPVDQRRAIVPMFRALFEKTWEPAHTSAGVP